VVSRRPFTAETRGQSRESPVASYGGKSGSGTRFSPFMMFSSVTIVPPGLGTYLHDAFLEEPTGEAWEPSNKTVLFWESELCNKSKLLSFFHKF